MVQESVAKGRSHLIIFSINHFPRSQVVTVLINGNPSFYSDNLFTNFIHFLLWGHRTQMTCVYDDLRQSLEDNKPEDKIQQSSLAALMWLPNSLELNFKRGGQITISLPPADCVSVSLSPSSHWPALWCVGVRPCKLSLILPRFKNIEHLWELSIIWAPSGESIICRWWFYSEVIAVKTNLMP